VHAIERMFPEDAPYPSRLVPLGTRFQEKEKPLKCPVCKQGETREGTATVTLERDDVILVFKKVPAEVCEVCGEEYVDEQTTARLLAAAEEAVRAGVQVDIREYVAA
jgi:YgiT-type zinc finger domain-containing protein